MAETEDLESWKVTELQNELKKRGLDTKGRKADLIIRLRQAISNGIEVTDIPADHSDTIDDESVPAEVKDETSSPSSAIEDEDEDDEPEQTSTEPLASEAVMPVVDPPEEPMETMSNKKRSLTDDDEEGEENDNEKSANDDPDNDESAIQRRKKKSRWGSEQDDEEEEGRAGDESADKQTAVKRASDDDDNADNNSTTSDNRHRDRDHYRSSRHDDDRHHSSRRSERSPEKEIPLPEEETVQFNPEDNVLDFYTSDLNLTINPDCLSVSNKSNDALCFLWGGTRATYGFKQGKICYEIRITEIIDSPNIPESEKEKFGIRVGWSNLSSGLHALQLGEINDSYAYTSSGKKMRKSNDELIEDAYGESFGSSDILGCYIDFGDQENANIIQISFTKNGQDFGSAFEIDKTTINDETRLIFYPHILIKNVQLECNFGQQETSWSQTKPGYLFPQNIPLNERIRGSEPVVEKIDCQVVLLSGLYGCGKTTWAKKYLEDNPTKHFELLNVESILNRMTIDGKLPPIKDRNDGLMLRVNVCLQKLIEIAARRRRNYIIDHVNINRETQSKRQRLFTGYHRIGVVIVPDDDELKARIEKVERAENISMPWQWIRDGKGKFHFLQKGSSLEEVIYPELAYEDARSLYERARRDSDQHRSSSSRYDRHDDYRSSRHERNRYDDHDRGGRDRDRDRYDRHERSRSRERGSRDRDRRSSRDDSRYSSSRRNDNYGGGGSHHNNNNYRGGGGGGGGGGYSRGGYSDYRQDSRNNNYNQRGSGGGFQGRGGNNYNNNQSNEGWRGGGGGGGSGGSGFHQQQRNDFGGGGRGRGDFRGGNQFNNRGSYHDNQRGGGGYRSDMNNQQRGRQFNDYDNKPPHQGNNSGFMANNNNNFNQQNDRQGFGSRSSMPQQQPQNSFQNQQQQQQRPQPLLQNPPSNHPQQQQQQPFSSQQFASTNSNPALTLQTQNSLGLNPTGVTQPTSLDSWFALYAAALNPQATQPQQQQQQQQQQIQPQQDANSLTQQWSQWLKTAQMGQAAQQQQQPQLAVQQPEAQSNQQLTDATALYYQAYYAQLAAAQQQAAVAAAAAAAANGSAGQPGSTDKS